MRAARLFAVVAVACNSGSGAPPSSGVALDKSAVLEKLTGSRAAISHLKSECQLLYSDPPPESLGSIVNSQYQEALTWEAACLPGPGRRSDCTVTLANDQGEDAEFMARYSFELDENEILIESSVDCLFAG